MYFVYALKSLKHDRIYIGISINPSRRLREHNFGETRSIKFYRPYKIIYQEKCRDRIEARKREKYFKTGKGREEIRKKIISN